MSAAAATALSVTTSRGRALRVALARALPSARPAPPAHVCRAAAQENAAAVEPTQVPRAKGVRDGEWNDLDARLVEESQSDARATYERSILTAAPSATTPSADDLLRSLAPAEFHLLGLTTAELKTFAKENGLPAFRGKQLRDHLYGATPARTVDDLTTLPKSAREALKAANARIGRSAVHHVAAATDGTAKLLLRLADDRVVETVGIPATENGKHRLTACVSSQVGCPMRCTFCATGKGGSRAICAARDCGPGQSLEEHFGTRGHERGVHGHGRALAECANVLRAHDALNREVGIGARHITISTVGVRGSLERLAAARLQSTLAVSLHAPDQTLRESLIPSAKAYPLNDLLDDCEQYFVATGRRVTFEYTLLAA